MKIGSVKSIIALVLIALFCGNLSAQNLLKIRKIEVSGNSKTKEEIILRELNFKLKDSLSATDIEKYIETMVNK
jgi:cell division septal protein FtsQ